MSSEEAVIGFGSTTPNSWMPYSVSIPQTLGMATASDPTLGVSQVLPGTHTLDRASSGGRASLGYQGAHVDDPLALLSRDLGPVVWVGRIRKVLVLFVFLLDRLDQVGG